MIAVLLATIGSAVAGPVEQRQVLAAVRALAYDRKLAERSGAVIDLVILHQGEPSKAEADRIATVLGALGAFTIQDLPVRVVNLEGTAFLRGTQAVDVVLLPGGLGAEADALIGAARSRGALVAGFDLGYLSRGAVLGVVTNQDQLRLVVDVQGSRAMGASFSSQLLQLAELYP